MGENRVSKNDFCTVVAIYMGVGQKAIKKKDTINEQPLDKYNLHKERI